jgi:hypothetical protein
MLKVEPGSDPLRSAPDLVFRVWRDRERVELEAAGIFDRLARDLTRLRGPSDPVAALARTASSDELRHATFCQEILRFGPLSYRKPAKAPESMALGPPNLSLANRVLYTAVAVCCITETLSTALLLAMHKRAAVGTIRQTVHRILEDEVSHSQVGWAELSRAAGERDIGWVSDYVPAMIQAALIGESGPTLTRGEAESDFSRWGILPPSEARALMNETIHGVILPGLGQYGVEI